MLGLLRRAVTRRIIAGHKALGRIRTSEGQLQGTGMAKVGLALGYFQVMLAFCVGILILLLLAFGLQIRPAYDHSTKVVSISTPAMRPLKKGVMIANEIGKREMEAAEKASPIGLGEEIICLYNASDNPSEPEMAILTSKQIAYLKEDRVTSFPLKDVETVSDNAEYNQKYRPNYTDYTRYMIEVKTRKGARMRIAVMPMDDGPSFYQALLDSWKAESPEAAAKLKKN